jgi:hypothetical protein
MANVAAEIVTMKKAEIVELAGNDNDDPPARFILALNVPSLIPVGARELTWISQNFSDLRARAPACHRFIISATVPFGLQLREIRT